MKWLLVVAMLFLFMASPAWAIDYAALISEWAVLTAANPADTQGQKLALLNALTVSHAASPAIVPTYKIYNCLNQTTDVLALTATQQQSLRDIYVLGTVDISAGTPARTQLFTVFPSAISSEQTCLLALIASFNNAATPWWSTSVAQGGGGLPNNPTLADLAAAGNLQ